MAKDLIQALNEVIERINKEGVVRISMLNPDTKDKRVKTLLKIQRLYMKNLLKRHI